tara:strand:+ start:15468 stop:19688 length:4221 start_codon:yes stop_codon:yes gene_type:complete
MRNLIVFLSVLAVNFNMSSQAFTIDGITGIEFSETVLDSEITIDDDLVTYGIAISPNSLVLKYTASSKTFELTGSSSVSFDGNQINAAINLSIVDQVLSQLSFDIDSDFSIASLSFQSETLSFDWNIANSQFEIFGEASIDLDNNTVNINLGSNMNPGFVIQNGIVDEIKASIRSNFSLKGLQIEPQNLTFEYVKSDNSYKMYGALKSSLESNQIELQLGNSSEPGLIIEDGDIKKIETTVNADFSFAGMKFEPNTLTFLYKEEGGFFEMYGAANISFDGESLAVSLGTSNSPGLEYRGNIIEKINLGISSNFSLKGLQIEPQNLTFEYVKSDNSYKMHGFLRSSLEGNQIELQLGISSEPGLIIEDGDIKKIETTITADFSFSGIRFEPNNLTFLYNESSAVFEMYGETNTYFDGESVLVSLGTSSSPGLEYRNNQVEKINMGVSSNFSIKEIEIEPINLTFEYEKFDQSYKMHGELKSEIEDNKLELEFGNTLEPGVIIRNGIIEKIEATVTGEFSISDILFKPLNLTFFYNSITEQYEMYGELDVTFDNESIFVNLGDDTSPGLEYKNNSIQKIDIGVTSDFKLKELEIKPTDLTFMYDKSEERYEMYGDISFKVGDDEIEAILGDASDPGMVYEKEIKHVNIGVSTEFKISGLKIKATDVGVEWSSGSYYHLYGDADLSIANDDIDADFGTFSNPGIKIKSGVLHALEVDLNSDLKLGGLEVETKDLDVKYSNKKFEVTGELTVTEVFSLSVTLGDGNQGGLEIDVSGNEPKFKLEDFTIDIEHANLGAIDLKQIKLEFDSTGIVESDVKIAFPEGWEVDAVMKFKGNPSKIDAIDISYRADNLEEAIEIFEGVQLTYLDGNISNITKPSKLTVGASIGTIYGGGFTLDNKSATFLETGADVTISKSSFKVKGDVNVGAYREGTNSWKAILGDGSIDLNADFGHYVKVDTDIKYPGDPLIEAKINAYLDSHGHFDALVDVGFIVPHWVPFIGGKHYGSVDGAVRYKKGYLKDSFGAGWVNIKTFWHTYHEGAKFNFGTRKISSIGSGSIKSIEKDIKNDESKVAGKNATTAQSIVHTFTVPQPAPNSMLIDIDWNGEVSNAIVNVVGPEGVYELTKAVVLEQNDISTTPTLGYEENFTLIEKDTVTTFIFKTPSAFSEEEIIHSDLIAGRYQLIISFPEAVSEIDTIQFNPKWQMPSASINVDKNDENEFNLDIAYWSSLPDSTYVSFYVNTEASYEESRLINHIKANNFDETGYGSEQLSYAPHTSNENSQDLYFYAVIEDGVNPPLLSEISSSYSHSSDLSGTIILTNSSTEIETSGLRIFIDEDKDNYFDTISTGGLEKFSISNEEGYFAFRNLGIGTHSVKVVLPEGYRIKGKIDRFSEEEITYNGSPLELNFEIETY